MRRLLRYILIWLSCTVCTVTVVFFAVGFVLDSTSQVPPMVRPVPTSQSLGVAVTEQATPVPSPLPVATDTTSAPQLSTASAGPSAPGGGSPSASAEPTPAGTTGTATSCAGGAGAHTAQSTGGQATIRFGSQAVCLISAVPAPGFTTQTQEVDAGTLVITFSSGNHRSQLTATLQPQPQVVVRETSW